MIQSHFDKLNKRTTYEWNEFMKKYGSNYDELSEEGKRVACNLAEKQGERSAEIRNKF